MSDYIHSIGAISMRSHTRTFVLTILFGLLGARLAGAQNFCDYQSEGTGGNWASLATWKCYDETGWYGCDDSGRFDPSICYNHVPAYNNTATILAGDLVFIEETQEAIGTLTIQDDASDPGELQLNTAADQQLTKLTIHSSLVMEDTNVPGKISFVDGTYQATAGELVIQGNNMTAAGEIVAESSYEGGKITVNGTGFRITGDLSVTAGYLNVVGIVKLDTGGTFTATGGITTFDGTFENDGGVAIDGTTAVTVEFKGAGGIACDSGGSWLISNPNGVLRVTTASTTGNPNGSLTLENGRIDVNADFRFDGKMTWKDAGIIDVATDKVFLAASGNLADCEQ